MTNKKTIKEFLQTLEAGVKYGIIFSDETKRSELLPVDDYFYSEFNDKLYIYSGEKEFDIDDLNKKFHVLNLVFNYGKQGVYAGERITYKGKDVAVVIYQDDKIFLLDVEENDIYTISLERFKELIAEKKITVSGEFFDEKEESTPEPEPPKEEKLEKEPSNLEDFPSVSLGKIGDKYIYICTDRERGKFDLITVAFVGNLKTGLEYSRKQVDILTLEKLIKSGELKLVEEKEFYDYAMKNFKK